MQGGGGLMWDGEFGEGEDLSREGEFGEGGDFSWEDGFELGGGIWGGREFELRGGIWGGRGFDLGGGWSTTIYARFGIAWREEVCTDKRGNFCLEECWISKGIQAYGVSV